MPIVSHNIESTLQPNGGRNAVMRFYDQDGKEYMLGFYAAPGVDLDAVAASKIADLDEQLAVQELEALVGAVT